MTTSAEHTSAEVKASAATGSSVASAEALRPFDVRMIRVDARHWIYVEEVGCKGGRPVVMLHGGPGSGCQHIHRTLFDPKRDHVFLFDQRGSGRSHPYLELDANTTPHLVGDIEAVRSHFNIDKWLVVGGSWGSTLALAYAQTYPERVSGLVLRAIFLGTRREVEWAFVEGPKLFRPELFAAWRDALPVMERGDPLNAYIGRLLSADATVRNDAAHRWHAYERALSELAPALSSIPLVIAKDLRTPPTPIIEAHYIRRNFFLEVSQLLDDCAKLRGIPGAIIQGRYDLLCPPAAAHALAAGWGNATLQFLDGAGHAMTEPGVMEAMRAAISRLQGVAEAHSGA